MDIKDLLVLPPAKQRHIMKALANLAKYNGIYEEWNRLRRQHQLKWSSTNTLDVFERIINNGTDYDKMLEYVKQVLSILPRSHANVIIFGTLTGLRPIEACKSVQLIHADLSNYLNSDLFILEHFKWKEIFIQATKKSFISVMTDRLLRVDNYDDNVYPRFATIWLEVYGELLKCICPILTFYVPNLTEVPNLPKIEQCHIVPYCRN